jgi:hypothetical protein
MISLNCFEVLSNIDSNIEVPVAENPEPSPDSGGLQSTHCPVQTHIYSANKSLDMLFQWRVCALQFLLRIVR